MAADVAPAAPDRGATSQRRTRPNPLDLLVAAGSAGAALVVLLTSSEAGGRAPDALGAGLLLVAGAALVVRRRWPAAVLLVVTATSFVYLSRDYAGGAELPLMMAALYTAVAEGRRWVALAILTVTAGGNLAYRLRVDGEDPLIVVVTVSLLVLITLLGDAVQTRRRLQVEVQRRLEALEAEKELEARNRLTAERLRIGRELHDVLAHTITAITVQAGATADGLEAGSEARQAMRTMRATAQDAMQQLRATVAILRSDEDPDRYAAPRLADVPELVDGLTDAGIDASVEVIGDAHELPAVVELTGFRIVQEAVTNILRHSHAEHARVELVYHGDALTLTVEDDGGDATTPPDAAAAGFGLIGMQERAQAIGGHVTVGANGTGFRVRAVLPIAEVLS